MGEFRAEKRVVIAHQMEWIRDEGLKKLVKSSIWKKLTNLWTVQLWHDGHHGVLQDYPGRVDFKCDTHKVCFYLSLRYAFSDPKSSVPGSGPSLLIIIAVMSTIITKNHWVIKVETSSREKMRLLNVTCASRAWQETHIEPIGPITPKLSNCSLQSSDCHFHCVSDGHCHYVFVIISSSPIGCHCLNISDILWLSMSLFFYNVCLHLGLFI